MVYSNGDIASKGRDTILPSYLEDFENGKQVDITRGPIVSDGREGIVDVDVTLVARVGEEDPIQLDVVYSYNTETMTQVKHVITNVKVLSN